MKTYKHSLAFSLFLFFVFTHTYTLQLFMFLFDLHVVNTVDEDRA